MTDLGQLVLPLSFETVSLPLRYRIAQLNDSEQTAVPRPSIGDHPRTLTCARLIDQELDKLPFHGFDSLESILKVFAEHGIDREDPYYQTVLRQVQALNGASPQLYRGLGKPGKILDEHRGGGAMLIRAACLARAGLEDETMITTEITEALEVFGGLPGITHKDELVILDKGKFIVRKGVFLPGYYHLLILAYTHRWRTTANITRVRQAVTHLCKLSLPYAFIKFGSQLVAPASLNEQHWMEPWKIHHDAEKAMWIERMILLLQADLADEELSLVIKDFAPSITGQWAKDIRKSQPFLKWGAYSGVGLEPDWKSRERKTIDLWFRARQLECLLNPEKKAT